MGIYDLAPKPFAMQRMANIDESIHVLESAMEDNKDNKWDLTREAADRASHAMDGLMAAAPAIPTKAGRDRQSSLEELRAMLKAASDSLQEARQAIQEKDAERLKAAMQQFHESYDPIATAAAAEK